MGYAIELCFDSDTEMAVRRLRRKLVDAGLPATLTDTDERPHISLAVFNTLDADFWLARLKAFAASLPPFAVTLSAVGSFPTAAGIVFLAPTPTRQLLDAHQRLLDRLRTRHVEPIDYYLPEQWIPHCTVAMNFTEDETSQALAIVRRELKPTRGLILELDLVEVPPLRRLGSFRLGNE